HPVEGSVDFDGVEAAGEVLQLTSLGEVRRVEALLPALVAPAGNPDADGHGATGYSFRSQRVSSRTRYFWIVLASAPSRSMSSWFARTTRTKRMSASSSAMSPSGSSAFFFFGP